jgi:chromosome segregation ATPase
MEKKQGKLDQILEKLDSQGTKLEQHDEKFNKVFNKLEEQGKKLEEHDDKFDRIFGKLEEHDKKFDGIDKRFDGVDKRFDGIDNVLKAQATEFIQIHQKFEKMDTKIDNKFGQVLTGLDKVMGELEKAREDRVTAKSKDDDQDRRLNNLEFAVGIKSA